MKIKALITMLVLGSSSVALARPVAVSGTVEASWTYGTTRTAPAPAPIVRDHRAPGWAPAPAPAQNIEADCRAAEHSPPFVPVWTTLGATNQIANGQMSFAVGQSAGKFRMLKLQSTAGKSLINQVKIQFTNGRTQVVELNKYLTAANPVITIALGSEAPRAIRNITVVGRNARMSGYSVLAI
ncbi:MAG TPA: hypothetical protein VN253_17300 [Kofleriaceae bacterium]|nr:hypothetical protein [Kofleriaceae bacterium]